MNYIQVDFDISPEYPWKDIMTQELANIGFESFSEENKKLQAFVPESIFNEIQFNQLIENYKKKDVSIKITKNFIPSQNWNAIWESDYKPVEIADELLIRAPFHPENNSFKLSIEIQPQMSFGTGHHQTTYLLCQTLLNMDFKDKSVLDVGTGTGILGVLASKLGAESVLGTDIEKYAVENAIENCGRNNVVNFTILEGDIDVVPKNKFDVILANINRNVLMRHLESYAAYIKVKGLLILSGFFETDIDLLSEEAQKQGFNIVGKLTNEKWAVLKLQKTQQL